MTSRDASPCGMLALAVGLTLCCPSTGATGPGMPDGITETHSASGIWELGISGIGRERSAAIYDPVRDRILVFGGHQSGSIYPDDVLIYSAGTSAAVSSLATSGPRPPGRVGHTAIYDPVHDRVVIFGGGLPPGSGPFGGTRINDVWALSLSGTPSWTQINPAGTPPAPRAYHTAIYDPGRRRMVVYGGFTTTYANDVWALSLDENPTWTQLLPGGATPGWVAGHSAIYDPGNDRMVAFGGESFGFPKAFVSALSFTSMTWVELSPSGQPPSGRWGHRAVYDAWFASMVVFGGQGLSSFPDNDVWVMSLGANPAWFRQAPSGSAPSPRLFPGMVYDPSRRQSEILGGSGGRATLNDVWALGVQGSIWSELSPPGMAPTGRGGHILVYEPRGDRMLMFGGIFKDPEVWALALNEPPTWSRLAPSGTPPPGRWDFSAVYDPIRRRMIVYGGRDEVTPAFGDLWELSVGDSAQWSPLAASGTPPSPRHAHSAIYDPIRDRMIVHGGFSDTGYQRDTWGLSLSGTAAWERITPTFTPSEVSVRYGHVAIYDPDGDRMVIFGGADGIGNGETWVLSLGPEPTWTRLVEAIGPSERRPAGIYDAARGRLVVYGGAHLYDTWALSLGPDPRWEPIGGGTPPDIFGPPAIYDPVRDRMIVSCGYHGDTGDYPSTTWWLRWDEPVPALIAIADAEASSDRVVITWYGADAAGLAATVERRTESGDWTPVGDMIGDGTGRFRWEDVTVSAGTRYGYRLAYESNSGQTWTAEQWVQVPAAALTLRGFCPNPAGRELSVEFTLLRAGPATLELFDPAGRMVLAREVGDLGPGAHRIALSSPGSIPNGVYALRLTQAGQSITRRGAVLR